MELAQPTEELRRFEPAARSWRRHVWAGGSFDSALRPATPEVEGTIRLHHPTLLVLLEGGCERIEVASECGHRYAGPDFAGAVSFMPAGCGRRIRMTGVRSRWASLSIRPDLLARRADGAGAEEVGAFTNLRDPFLSAMLGEMYRLQRDGGGLAELYCDAMAASAGQYIARRYGHPGRAPSLRPDVLPAWRLRRVLDHVAANLASPDLGLNDLARCAGLSNGFFHRAFRQATGETPWALVQRLRIERAMHLLATSDLGVLRIALEVGFLSPSHFSRLFQRRVGLTPSLYRSGRRR